MQTKNLPWGSHGGLQLYLCIQEAEVVGYYEFLATWHYRMRPYL